MDMSVTSCIVTLAAAALLGGPSVEELSWRRVTSINLLTVILVEWINELDWLECRCIFVIVKVNSLIAS